MQNREIGYFLSMIVFLLLSVPCWIIFLNSFFQNDGIRKRDYFFPMGKGAVLYVAALLLSWFFSDKLVLGKVTALRLFFYDLRYYNSFTIALWLFFYLLTLLFGKAKQEGYRFRELLLYVSGLFIGESIYRVIIRESWYGPYELFFFPLGNLGMIVLLAVLLVRMDQAAVAWRILLFFMSLAVVLFFNLVPTLFSMNLPLPASVLGALLFVLSLMIFRAEGKGNLPGSSIKYLND